MTSIYEHILSVLRANSSDDHNNLGLGKFVKEVKYQDVAFQIMEKITNND